MGSRITRAATHLSEEAVRKRMQGEQRPWCRRRWQIIYQALTAPRQAEDIARTVGVSLTTVRRVMATYKHGGVSAVETPGKGGRRHQYLTLEQERAFLQPFMARAAPGEKATVAEIQRASARRDEAAGCSEHHLSPAGPPWLETAWCRCQFDSAPCQQAYSREHGVRSGAEGAVSPEGQACSREHGSRAAA
jgi:hypothetical protein